MYKLYEQTEVILQKVIAEVQDQIMKDNDFEKSDFESD